MGQRILRVDIQAVYDRDPACTRFLEAVLYFKGFHAIRPTGWRIGCLNHGRRDFALYLQSRSSWVFQTDINPAARIGKGIFLDHATGLVVGETAVIGDNVSILHGVTLGGTGKEGSDRHPKIGNGVLIGAGAKILGNIQIGHCSRVAAGSVVLKEVPPKTTVAGVPARVVGEAGCSEPSRVDGPVARFLRDLIAADFRPVVDVGGLHRFSSVQEAAQIKSAMEKTLEARRNQEARSLFQAHLQPVDGHQGASAKGRIR